MSLERSVSALLAAIVSLPAHDKTLKVLEGSLRLPSFPSMLYVRGRARGPSGRTISQRALHARRRRRHRAGPAERYCSPSRSCARCVTSSASGRTYAAHSVDCSTDAAAVQPTASRWCDNLEREPEREQKCGPSHVPWPQPDSWFADKVVEVPTMEAAQAPQPE